jgi:hypothetical protein
MRRAPLLPILLLAAASLCGCAGRRRPRAVALGARPAPSASAAHVARAERLLEEAKAREPHVPMLSEAEARAALASMEKYPQVPNLIRILARAPKTVDAEMAAWDALRKGTTLDKRLLNQVFWVVSSGNECGH